MRKTQPLMCRKLSVLVLIGSLTASTTVWAQEPPAAGNLRQSADTLAAAAVAGRAQAGARRSDSLVNGALIGAGVAVATELFVCTRLEPWENCRDDVGPMLKFAAIGAGIGMAVDALIRGRQSPQQIQDDDSRIHAAAIVDSRARGLQISLVF
jgi:hypothetical protein